MLAIEILAKGTVLLMLAFGLAAALRQASAATRHLVWAVGLLVLLALPLLTAGLPWRLDVLPAYVTGWTTVGMAPETPAPADPATSLDPTAGGIEATTSAMPSVTANPLAPESRTVPAPTGAAPPRERLWIVLAFWLAGAALVAGRWVAGWAALRRCVRRARPLAGPAWDEAAREASDRLLLDTPVQLLESDRVPMPLAAGIVRPVVVLPEFAREWPDERRRAVIVHELAHVRRRDALAHGLAWIVCALWWFHPMAWVAARRMRAESERACDDMVLRAGTRPSSYADHLLDIVCHAPSPRAPAPAMPLAQRSEFEGRMLRILSPDARRHGLSALKALGIAGAFAVVAVPLAAIGPAPAEVVAEIERSPVRRVVDAILPDALVNDVRRVVSGDKADTNTTTDEIEVVSGNEAASQSSSASKSTSSDTNTASAKAALSPEVQVRMMTSLIASLGDTDPEVRNAAAQALGNLGDPRAVEALMRALRSDSDAGVRAMAAWALGEIEDPRAVPALGEALRRDQDAHVREMAAWALGEIEDPQGVEPLRAALRDASPEVRVKAVWALGQIEDAAAVPALAEALRDANPEIRQMAAWALGEIEDPSAVNALVGSLQDSDAEVRSTAAWAIGEIQPAAAPPALIAAAGDANADVRSHVAWALGEIEDPAAVPALRRLIHDSSAEVRKDAIWALTEIQAPDAYEALVELLNDENPEVRKAAARALGDADWDKDEQ